MKIFLVRHGQSRWQVKRNDDDWNSPLTELGVSQATHLSQWLVSNPVLESGKPLEIVAIHSSPYIRANQTAEPISRSLHLPIQTDADLREASFLVSDHLPSLDSPNRSLPDFVPSCSYETFKSQAKNALEKLVASAENTRGPVLAVSHGGLISTLLRLTVGSDFVSFWIYNASLHLIEWKRGRWHLVFLNLSDHLPPELRTF